MLLALSGCGPVSYSPSDHLSTQQQEDFKWKIIRYIGRSPDGLTPAERFYPQYDSHYLDQKALHALDAWYEKNGTVYFMLSRRAPSLVEKRVATGGVVRFDANNEIEFYEEQFRTWKMVPDTLKKRSMLLFDLMVKGKSLEPYRTINSKGIDYIEFPDERTLFDVKERTWKMR
jgi:hypothetical protein